MRAAISWVTLLLCMWGTQTRSTQTEVLTEGQTTGAAAAAAAEVSTQLLDVSAELKELRDMVVAQGVILRYTHGDIKVLEVENILVNQRQAVSESKVEVLEAENVAVNQRLAVSENKVEALGKVLQDTTAEMKTEVDNLKKENAAQEAELAALKTRLASSEAEVMNVKKENAAQEMELAALKTRLAATEAEVEDLKMVDSAALLQEMAALKTRLAATESAIQDLNTANELTVTDVKDLKMDSAAHEQELDALKTRLAATESTIQDLHLTNEVTVTEVEDLKRDSAAHEQELAALRTGLAAGETAIDDLKVENAAQEAELTEVKTRLAATETEVENLEKEIQVAPKVAFSAGLAISGYIEAGSNALTVVFNKVITNVGQAYDDATGVFTAPVRGVYYFRFTVMDRLDRRWMSIEMQKNGEPLMRQWEWDTDSNYSYLSSGLTLQLEKGDTVNMVLPADHRLFDSSNTHNTFSGFLLFSLSEHQ